jgi:hypothetical protein
MGAAAARMAVDLALEPAPPETNRLELATKLVVRASTAPPGPVAEPHRASNADSIADVPGPGGAQA